MRKVVRSREGRTLREIVIVLAFCFAPKTQYIVVSALTDDASIYAVRSVDGIWFVWIFQVVTGALLSAVGR